MEKRVNKFEKALTLMGPVIKTDSRLILENEPLVNDAINGFDILYDDYKKRVLTAPPGQGPLSPPVLPRSSFLYYLSSGMDKEGVELTPENIAREIKSVASRAGPDRVQPVDLYDPEVARVVLSIFGALGAIGAISGVLRHGVSSLMEARYHGFAKKFNSLPTTYQTRNPVKYERAVGWLDELYDTYLVNQTAAAMGAVGTTAPLDKDQFLAVMAVITYIVPLGDDLSMRSLIEYLARTQPKVALKKMLGPVQLIDILTIVYGFDLCNNEYLFGRYAIGKI